MSNIRYLNNLSKFKRRVGAGQIVEAAPLNGARYDANDWLYVRVPGGYSDGSASVKNPIFPMRVQSGIAIEGGVGRKLYTGLGYDDRIEIKGNVQEDLRQIGYNPRQLNAADPSTRYNLIALLIDLQAFVSPNNDGTVQVVGGWVRRPNGKYLVFQGQTGIDIIALKPATAGKQLVVCLWLNLDTGSITTTTSSEIDESTVLTSPANLSTLETLVNECADSAPSNSQGVWAFWVGNSDTTSTFNETHKLCDLRGIIGSGAGGTGGQLEPVTNGDLTSPELIFANGDVIMAGVA